MIAVIFEVWPNAGMPAAPISTLPPSCARCSREVDGFISIERFESLSEPGKTPVALGVSRRGGGRGVAQAGRPPARPGARPQRRSSRSYRLRIAGVIRDYGMDAREEAPQDSVTIHG